MHGKPLASLRRRIAALKSFQAKLLWPRLEKIKVHGETYSLPFAPPTKPARDNAPESVLAYLAGFFDGDGCVSSKPGAYILSVTQSSSHPEVLLLFAQVFAGKVYLSQSGKGLKRPQLAWCLTKRKDVQMAAVQLAQRSFVKRHQLLLAADQPHDAAARKASLKQELSSARAQAQAQDDFPALKCSWPFVAGFFDAEGCISARPPRYMRLTLTQKTAMVLHWIAAFWQLDVNSSGSLHHRSDGYFELFIDRQKDVRLILRRLLNNGLSIKRARALLALSVGNMYYQDIRQSIAKLSGNQSKYRRLTEEGMQRSQVIASLRRSARNRLVRGQFEKSKELLDEVDALRSRHEHLNAVSVYGALQHDIRQLLAQGAVPGK